MSCLVDGSLCVKRELSVDLCRDLARNNLENLFAKLNQESVECCIDLFVNLATLALCENLELF